MEIKKNRKESSMDEKKVNNLKFWSIIILLIIIILILFFFTNFGKIGNNLVPTGKVDVFDIDIECDCQDDGECTTIDENNNKITVPVFDKQSNKDDLGIVFVDDKNGNYIYQQNLQIFNNAAFQYTDKIAPGVSNTYHFVVYNSTKLKLRYYVEMYETTEHKVNLKYRLKRNNSYVIGNDNKWVTANELKTEFSKINASTSDNYSLDWKWEYEDGKDNEDTIAGENMTSNYKLNIRFYFESIN